MRLNPFSKSAGRRRAAMIRGDASAEDATQLDTGQDREAVSPAENDAFRSGDDGKQFGFAYRSGQDQDDVHTGYDQAEHRHRQPHQADHQQSEAGPHLVRPAPQAVPRAHEEPVVSTPHIERLREQIGTDAADTIQPWLSEEETGMPARAVRVDEPKARSAPIAAAPEPAPIPPFPPAADIDQHAVGIDQPAVRFDQQAIGIDPHAAGTNEAVGYDAELPPQEPPGPPIGAAPPFPAAEAFIDHEPQPSGRMVPDIEQVPIDPIEDVAVTIGRIVSIKGSVIWGALFDDIDGQAARAARMGALVSMRGPESRVFGIVNSLEREQLGGSAQSERTVFEIQVLGEIADDRTGFQRGVSSYPPLDAPVTTITIRDIATIYARPRCSNVHIGQLRHNPKVPAFVLTDSLLGKHFAVLGTTGTGKSCATTVILRSILDEHPKGHVVLIDPHNEYGAAFADRAELLNPGNLHLPYWLLNFEEIAHILLGGGSREQMDSQSALLKNAIIQAKTQFVGDRADSPISVDTPVPYRLSDLMNALKEAMGMFNKAEGSALYLGLINRIESLASDQRYGFMFSRLAVRDNMEQILAQLLRIPTGGKPMTIIDISGLPSEVVDVVVSVLFRLTFELAVWSERGKAPPVLLVCEEAHRYVPEESDVGFAPTKRVIAQIAKEGRKYGVTLCLVSQRPSELAVSSLAQCNTIFALRMSNEHDQAFVSQTLSENARWLVDSLPSLNTQEAVVVGDGVTVPVHIRFKDLPPAHRPASHDPSYAKSWCQEADPRFLTSAIDRWRRQTR